MKKLLDKHELAEVIRKSVSWVEKAVAGRKLPITWVGNTARFDPDDIADWLEEHKEKPASAVRPLRLVSGPRPPAGPPVPRPPAGPPTPSKKRGVA